MCIIVKPSTIFVIFSNILTFMFMQLLLFWYVISKAVENIILNKTNLVQEIITVTDLNKYINLLEYKKTPEYINLYQQALIDKENRNKYNIDLTWQWMLTPFSFVIFILVFDIFYIIYVHFNNYQNLKIDKTDILIFLTVFLSFTTEIILIFVLLTRYIYISDTDVLIFLIKLEQSNEIINSIINEYISNNIGINFLTFSPF